MRIDIEKMAKVADEDSFVNVFSGLLDWYMSRNRSDFDANDLTFTCFDLVTILKANNQEIKPPIEQWSEFLLQPQKVELFEMMCKSTPHEVIEQRAFQFINDNGLFYHVKRDLYDKIGFLSLTSTEIAKNVYAYCKTLKREL